MSLTAGIPDKLLFGNILRFPLKFIPRTMVVPILQGRLKGKKWIVGSSNHGCWLGSYEFAKRLVFERTIREGSIVFDIGAHVGFYTLLASALVGPHGKVFAFEPVPRNLFYLKEHLRLNRVTNVIVIEAAVSDRHGMTLFDEGPNSLMGCISPNGKLQVRTVALDELIARGEITTPNYIKMDIEGTEVLALLGARSLLRSLLPTLFLATHGGDIQQESCRFLVSLGYQLERLDGRKVEQPNEVMAFRK